MCGERTSYTERERERAGKREETGEKGRKK